MMTSSAARTPAKLPATHRSAARTSASHPAAVSHRPSSCRAALTSVTKAAALPDDGYLHKSEFEIDLGAGTVTCPAGEVAHFAGRFRPGHSTEAVSPPPRAGDARS
jgi:hypothetical protein